MKLGNLAWMMAGILLGIAPTAQADRARQISSDRPRLEGGGFGYGAGPLLHHPAEPAVNVNRLREIRLKEALRDGDVSRDEVSRLKVTDPTTQAIPAGTSATRSGIAEHAELLPDKLDSSRKPKSFWREHRRRAIDTNGAEIQ